jgi:endonuclease-8
MPEGDTIFRAAGTLHRALAGRTVTRFESVFPTLSRVDDDTPLSGRTIDRVEARGKHLLMWFSAGPPEGRRGASASAALVLRTHMRMNGSWHIYRPSERWQRPHRDMRIVLETVDFHAVAFNVPVAELLAPDRLEQVRQIRDLGPDPLSDGFHPAEAAARIMARGDLDIADALLDQTAIAGIGNVYKSEVLFAGGINPFEKVRALGRQDVDRLVAIAVRYMRANVVESTAPAIETYRGLRRTTSRHDPGARLWVYGRAGKPCRRCGTPISRARQGPHARSTYWCPRCQSASVVGRDDASGCGPQKNAAPGDRSR